MADRHLPGRKAYATVPNRQDTLILQETVLGPRTTNQSVEALGVSHHGKLLISTLKENTRGCRYTLVRIHSDEPSEHRWGG
jgi:hypothetical protein